MAAADDPARPAWAGSAKPPTGRLPVAYGRTRWQAVTAVRPAQWRQNTRNSHFRDSREPCLFPETGRFDGGGGRPRLPPAAPTVPGREMGAALMPFSVVRRPWTPMTFFG